MTPPLPTAFGLYAVLTLALTWPLVLRVGSGVPNDLGDSLLNVFLLAWNARELPLTERWWNLPQFYPVPGAMAFSEHLIGLSLLTTPVIALTGNPLLGYNVAFLLSFPLCALAAHALAFHLTRRHDVAIVAGIAFGFAPYRMSQLAHVQVLSSYWMPLALLGLHRFLDDRRWRWLVLFAGAWHLQALACGYYLFYLSVLIGAWILWFVIGRTAWRDVARIALAWGVAVAALVPFALGYLRYLDFYGFSRGREEIESFSADLVSLLSASGNLRLWGWLNLFDRPESALFPGVTVVAVIVAAGVAGLRRGAAGDATRRRQAVALGAAAIALGLVAVTPLLFGPWRLEPGGIRLISVGTPGKPLALALLLGGLACARHPAGRAAWRRRSPLAFYTAAALLMWLLSLGPAPTVFGQPLFDEASAATYAPYSWLMMFPGVDGVRVPARFWTLATLCLAIAASLAAARLTLPMTRRPVVVPIVLAALMLLEAWPEPVRLGLAPALRPSTTDAVARIEIPMGPPQDVVALYRAAGHRLPVFNGYSGYFAPHYGVLMALVEGRHPDVLGRLAALGPIEVLVDHRHDPSRAWREFVAAHPGVRLAAQSSDYSLFLVPASPTGRDRPHGTSLPIAGIAASIHPDDVSLMTDGDLETRWHTGPQAPDNEIIVDLGAVRRVNVVELQLGGFHADFPRELHVDVSADRETWVTVWSGRTAADALWAAIEDPRRLPLRFSAHGTHARFVRLRQTGDDPVYY